eukprot:TRINITY_DN11604_c0_g1_i1.p1 TRINITY_DN11604_c0_g1~~TRINITY_DN11604_c0_g1_i1.p1  ORF type:complete len:277 (+),score=43.26 TRINITY_DN11604_c0_g1_i1:599-1429(+)
MSPMLMQNSQGPNLPSSNYTQSDLMALFNQRQSSSTPPIIPNPAGYPSNMGIAGGLQSDPGSNLRNSSEGNLMLKEDRLSDYNISLHDPSEFPRLGITSNDSVHKPLQKDFTIHNEDFPSLPNFKGSFGVHSSGSPSLDSNDHPHMKSDESMLEGIPQGYPNLSHPKSMNGPPRGSHPGYMVQSSNLNPGTATGRMSNFGYGHFVDGQHGAMGVGRPQVYPGKGTHDKYALLGLLNVIKMTDVDLSTLALGTDLTTLGLNLNSPECLYATFFFTFC